MEQIDGQLIAWCVQHLTKVMQKMYQYSCLNTSEEWCLLQELEVVVKYTAKTKTHKAGKNIW